MKAMFFFVWGAMTVFAVSLVHAGHWITAAFMMFLMLAATEVKAKQ